MNRYLVLDAEVNTLCRDDSMYALQVGVGKGRTDSEEPECFSVNIYPRPDLVIVPGAYDVHHLDIDTLRDTGVEAKSFFEELYALILDSVSKDYYIIGHNCIQFDFMVLNKEFVRAGLEPLDFRRFRVRDTGAIYKAYTLQRFRKAQQEWDFMVDVLNTRAAGVRWSLDFCNEDLKLGFDMEQAHDAGFDCKVTAALYTAMSKQGILDEVIEDQIPF